MAVRGEERRLPAAVRHVLEQDYPPGIELVLAVGPSKDRTREIVGQLAATDPRITVVDNPAGEIPVGLNLAIAAARHPVIVRVDARSLLPPGYLRTAVQVMRETGAVNVGGYRAAEGVTAFQQAVAWAMTSPAGVGPARYQTGGAPGPCDSVYLGAFRRDALDQAGGYRETYLRAEDWELNLRIRRAGGLIWFHPALAVTYRPRENLRALASQYWHYGRWRRVVAREHAGTINARYLAPPAVTLAVTAGTAAGLTGAIVQSPALLAAGLAVPALYAAGILAVTVTAARELPGRALALLPAVLATMHLCWGAGFLTSPRGLTSPQQGPDYPASAANASI
jgi:succinoglycan biosynthesis protein ExoA